LVSVWRPVDRFAEGVRRDQGAVRVTAERERALIGAAHRPVTVVSLRSDLEALGLAPGATVMVHASLSALGYVVGGPEAVVEALIGVIGPTGTLMMPAHSGQYTDPGSWRNPPVPVDWVETMRESMPPFDKAKSPTRMMGAIAEYFRLAPGVRRSNHPTVSAAAIGPNMATLLDGHSLNQGLGEGSPQARLYDLDGRILLLGASHANNTSMHVAEYRAIPHDHPLLTQRSPVIVEGERVWVDHDEIDEDNDFASIGEAFAATGAQRSGPVGACEAHLMGARALVDFATRWLHRHVEE
jgi:aminoglycoside 3-N-acetyltransferase